MAKKVNTPPKTTTNNVLDNVIIEEVTPSSSRRTKAAVREEMIFGKKNYQFIGIGLLIIVIGFLLMSGGSMPNPDVWDENIIYSARRITLAPFVVLVGLGTIVFAIFKD